MVAPPEYAESRCVIKWVNGTVCDLYLNAAAKSLQSCPTLCNPIDGSPPGSPVPEILQARILAWVAISFSNVWKWKAKVKSLSRVRPSATPWTEPTRLLHPWDFPGKRTGVGCHCLLQAHGKKFRNTAKAQLNLTNFHPYPAFFPRGNHFCLFDG